jgi:hypothetical protein
MPHWEPKPAADGSLSTGFVEGGRVRARYTTPPGTIASFGYLTPQAEFGDVERGNPLPYTLPPERRREVGLERETWGLEPGAVADVVVFDPATFAEPHRYPRGIPWVLVNGEPVIADGQHTGIRPGRVVAR